MWNVILNELGRLEQKGWPLTQLLPLLQTHKGLEHLGELVSKLDPRFRYALEARHNSWFQDLTYNFFANHNVSLVLIVLAELQTPSVINSVFVYMRFFGYRSIVERNFGRIRAERIEKIQK